MLMELSTKSNTEKNIEMEAAVVETAASNDVKEEQDELVIKLKKPYTFERVEYKEIDLRGLRELTAADMIAINKRMKRASSGIDVMPEVTLEYATEIAARGASLPIEFFTALPVSESMAVKNAVLGFLFGAE